MRDPLESESHSVGHEVPKVHLIHVINLQGGTQRVETGLDRQLELMMHPPLYHYITPY